jgi:predicted alpha/beta-fold hydrolase
MTGFCRHILPTNSSHHSDGREEGFWQETVRNGNHNGVMVYFHGVTGTRAKPHRKELYKVLQEHDYHIITCDYRGFADSTKVKRITESGVVSDALNVYRWVKNELLAGSKEIPVFVWGHSLGTG